MFQNMGQDARARPLRGLMGGAGIEGGLGKKQKEETQKDKPSRRWVFPAAGPGEMEASLFLVMPGLAFPALRPPYVFWGLTVFSQVEMLETCVFTVPWEK